MRVLFIPCLIIFSIVASCLCIFALCLAIAGCTSETNRKHHDETAIQGFKECFDSGGVEFQYGRSAGYGHAVCVYKRDTR